MADEADLQDVTATVTMRMTMNVPVARHWGIRLNHPDEVESFIRNEVLPRDFDPEGPLAGLEAVDVVVQPPPT